MYVLQVVPDEEKLPFEENATDGRVSKIFERAFLFVGKLLVSKMVGKYLFKPAVHGLLVLLAPGDQIRDDLTIKALQFNEMTCDELGARFFPFMIFAGWTFTFAVIFIGILSDMYTGLHFRFLFANAFEYVLIVPYFFLVYVLTGSYLFYILV